MPTEDAKGDAKDDFRWSRFQFHPVIKLPADYDVYDFTFGYDAARVRSDYGIGRYNEKRPGMYSGDLFSGSESSYRDIHIGIDIAAPVATPVYAFFAGTVFCTAIHRAEGDYGGTLITEHLLADRTIWALHGHLSHQSVGRLQVGARLEAGDVIAQIGDRNENGGWNSHLHFQLSLVRPKGCDLPGVVSRVDLTKALSIYPDPRLVLGPLY